jgi:hypothetical protein
MERAVTIATATDPLNWLSLDSLSLKSTSDPLTAPAASTRKYAAKCRPMLVH